MKVVVIEDAVKRSWAIVCREFYLLFSGMLRGECSITIYDKEGAVGEFSGAGVMITDLVEYPPIDLEKLRNVKVWWVRKDHLKKSEA